MNPSVCEYLGIFFVNYCALHTPYLTINQVPLPQLIQQRSFSTFTTEYQWSYINFTWPSYAAYRYAVINKNYIPENNAMAGIKIYKDNMYIALPRVRTGTPVTLARISMESSSPTDQLLQPYPSWDMNVKEDCFTLQNVQSMEIDSRGIMWVIDGTRINNNTKCPAKLVFLDLNNRGKVVHTFIFPDQIALRQGGFLNDIVVDETDGGFAYITDNSPIDPGIVIYSKQKNRAWKIRDRTMFGELGASGFVVENLVMDNLAPIDGIALSPLPKVGEYKERFLYYCSLVGFNLYSLSTRILKDEELCKTDMWRSNVNFVGVKQSQSDGMMMDNTGVLYYTLLPLYGVGAWDSSKPFASSKIVDQNRKTIVWPDSFSFGNNGYLYLLSNNINRFFNPSIKLELSPKILFRVHKLFTGTTSYLHINY